MEALKILVVDDESRMRKLVKDFLAKKNFQVLEAGDGEEAMDIFYKEKDIALLILDVMMPRMDGWEVCREIRKNSKVPIIMLTARSDERDELLGFELGVDEYISKPFSPKILVARVEAILRRTGQSNPDEILSAGGIVIDKAAHQATVDGKPMDLSFKEFELLTYFLENEGIALSREKNCLPTADSARRVQGFFYKEKSVSQRPAMAKNRQKQTLSGNCFLFVTIAVVRPKGAFHRCGRIFLAQKAAFCTKRNGICATCTQNGLILGDFTSGQNEKDFLK